MTKRQPIYLISYTYLTILMYALCLMGPELQAKTTLWTTHPQVAHDIMAIAKLHNGDQKSALFDSQPIFGEQTNGDIHEFKPNSGELKKLMQYQPIIAGPVSHQSWVKLAQQSGLLKDKSTYYLEGMGSNDHYWLSPALAKQFEIRINTILSKLGLKTYEELLWSQSISLEAKKVQELLKLKKISKVVLSHNALVPLLETFKELEVLVLYNDDHHQEVSAKDIKQVYTWSSKKGELLFIYERNITWPAPLKGKIFDKVRKVSWSPIGVAPLTQLRQALEDLP